MRRHSNCAKRQRNHQRRQEKCCCQRGRPTAPAGAAPAEPRAVRAVPGRSGCPPCSPAHLRPTSAGWSLRAGAGRWSADRQVQQMAGGQRADEPSCRQVGRHADQGQAQAGRACARGRHGTWRASPALLAARVPPTLRRVGGGAPRTGLQLGRGGFGVGGGCSSGVPELAVGTMGGAGAHDPWATAKHASGVRRALTLEERAPPILDLRRAKNTVRWWWWGQLYY